MVANIIGNKIVSAVQSALTGDMKRDQWTFQRGFDSWAGDTRLEAMALVPNITVTLWQEPEGEFARLCLFMTNQMDTRGSVPAWQVEGRQAITELAQFLVDQGFGVGDSENVLEIHNYQPSKSETHFALLSKGHVAIFEPVTGEARETVTLLDTDAGESFAISGAPLLEKLTGWLVARGFGAPVNEK